VISGSVHGREELRRVQTILDVTAPKQLEQDLLTGTRRALAPLRADVKAEALKKLPKRGGHAALLSRSLKVSTRVTGGKTVRARVDVSASGKRESRDVSALNRGVLRHPVFGHRSTWVTQRVRRGVVDDPVDRARDRVVDEARDAAEKFAHEVAHG